MSAETDSAQAAGAVAPTNVRSALRALFRVRSGTFAGWSDGERLYDATGRNVGYHEGAVLYSFAGSYLGAVVQHEWVGARVEATRLAGAPRHPGPGVVATPPPDRGHALAVWGLDFSGWIDPNF